MTHEQAIRGLWFLLGLTVGFIGGITFILKTGIAQ